MRSAVFQFLVVGALAVAWIWMLGRPLLTLLVRRTHRDSVSHFRHQQAVLGRSISADPLAGVEGSRREAFGRQLIGLQPVHRWRAQPKERRRLQLLLGFAMATFASVLLALALRGPFVRLFLVMSIAFVVYLLLAASIGARELRAREADLQRRLDRSAVRRRTLANDRDEHPPAAAADEVFGESVHEPVPPFEQEVEPEPMIEQLGPDEPAVPASSDTPFTAPSADRSRPARRPKARPIYIESEVDEVEGTIRAVND